VDPIITSPHNPSFKLLRSLRLRKHREHEGLYLVEGIRLVEEALTTGAPVETLVYAPELLVSERARGIVERTGADRRLAISADLFTSLSDREEPQGIAAVLRIEERPLSILPPGPEMMVIVAYQLSDPGNLGTIIRTADAAGATGVAVVTPSVDLYDPQTVRATMGSLFALPVAYPVGEADLDRWVAGVRASGIPLVLVGSSAHGTRDHFAVDYRQPLALLLGSERNGLPDDVRRRADLLVRLPMVGRATSLNVSAAAAALIYEIVRQRSQGPWHAQAMPE
jgi:TrmH family RNA methyltransferase